MRHFSKLRRDTGASTAMEFALAAIPLFMLILGIIKSGLLFWDWQALQGAAMDAGRCAALNATSCGNPVASTTNTQAYAANAAHARGVGGITSGNVTVLTGTAAQTACGGTTANVVSVSLSYQLGLIGFVPLPSSLRASACYPLSS
jgi:Flp pilus assembly protein TadG